MYFTGSQKRKWQENVMRARRMHQEEQMLKQYNKEQRQANWNKWTERVLRWFIITCIVMIYHLFVGALAIHIYQ